MAGRTPLRFLSRGSGSIDRALAFLALLNLALAGIYIVVFASLLASGAWRGADFTPFYTGFRIVLEGRGASLYDPAVQAEVQRSVLGGQTFEAGLNPFNNPPHLVLPFVPIGLLSLQAGFLVWAAFEVVLLGILVRLLLREARGWSQLERLAVAGWLLGFPSLAITFFQGAFSLLLAVAVVSAYVALRDGRDERGGLWLLVASIKPQAAAAAALVAFVGRKWRAVAAAIAGGLVLALAATAVLGVGIWTEYLGFLGTYTASFNRLSVDPSVMWNLRGTLTLMLGAAQATFINTVAFGGFLVGLATIALLWRRGWSRDADVADLALRFALALVIGLLLSPHLNPHDDLLLVVATVIGYGALRGQWLGLVLAIGASLAPALILFANGLAADAPTALPIRVPTVAGIALAVVLAIGLHTTRGSVRAPMASAQASEGAGAAS